MRERRREKKSDENVAVEQSAPETTKREMISSAAALSLSLLLSKSQPLPHLRPSIQPPRIPTQRRSAPTSFPALTMRASPQAPSAR